MAQAQAISVNRHPVSRRFLQTEDSGLDSRLSVRQEGDFFYIRVPPGKRTGTAAEYPNILSVEKLINAYREKGIFDNSSDPEKNGIFSICELLDDHSPWTSYIVYKRTEPKGDDTSSMKLTRMSSYISRTINELPSASHGLWRDSDVGLLEKWAYENNYTGPFAEIGKFAGSHCACLVKKLKRIMVEDLYSCGVRKAFISTDDRDALKYRAILYSQTMLETRHRSDKVGGNVVVASVFDISKNKEKFDRKYSGPVSGIGTEKKLPIEHYAAA